jgi:hypothetical protein
MHRARRVGPAGADVARTQRSKSSRFGGGELELHSGSKHAPADRKTDAINVSDAAH